MNIRHRNLARIVLLLGVVSCGLWGCGQSSGGGTTASGGTPSSGGTTASGGTPSSGGSVGTGGAAVSGGVTSTGGNPGGGSSATGGRVATGGSSSAGTGAGGTSPTGGNYVDGGATARGGATGTGGKGDAGLAGAVAGGSGSGGSGGGAGGSTGSVTCPSGAKPTDATKNLTVDSIARKYILHVPSAYTGTTAVPLVLDFHPIGGSASAWRTSSPYPAVIDKEGVISAFPDGLTGPSGQAWNVIGCCVSKVNGADVDDVAFAKAIIADIEKVACIDPKHIYAVGFSMGGGMSNWLACKAADVFAASGPASFDLTQQNETGCTPARPITVIEWRGKTDNVVPYAGGHSTFVTVMPLDFLGAVGTFQKWASLDGCTGNPSAADSSGCQTYSQCGGTPSVQVTLCTDANGGHEAANAGIVWPMLKKYALP